MISVRSKCITQKSYCGKIIGNMKNENNEDVEEYVDKINERE